MTNEPPALDWNSGDNDFRASANGFDYHVFFRLEDDDNGLGEGWRFLISFSAPLLYHEPGKLVLGGGAQFITGGTDYSREIENCKIQCQSHAGRVPSFLT